MCLLSMLAGPHPRSRSLGGRPAAVMGSSGQNAVTHPGIVDGPFASPTGQIGRITTGSATVLINNKPAATINSAATCCVVPATKIVPGVPTVLIG